MVLWKSTFILYFFHFIRCIISTCPLEGNVTVYSTLILSSIDFQSSYRLTPARTCKIILHPSNRFKYLIVSVSNFLHFSQRQPTNAKEIRLHAANRSYIVEMDRKNYRLLATPVTVEIPLNLNFRSLLVFTEVTSCSADTLKCPSLLHENNHQTICVHQNLLCNGIDSCGEETNCEKINGYTKAEKILMSAFIYDKNYPSSSQLMLIGFFLLNGFFLSFFVVLSMCSLGFFYSNKMYKAGNRRSRIRFLNYIRDASKSERKSTEIAETQIVNPSQFDVVQNPLPHTSLTPKTERRHRTSILSRINFEPAPTLTELEPESEDRTTESKDDICSPPKHRADLFLRRQSLPVLQLNKVEHKRRKSDWKTRSVNKHLEY